MYELKSSAVAAPKSILVVPFADGIGDFVNMQPILMAIAHRFPAATVSVAASGYAHYLLPPASPIKIITPSWFEREPGPLAQYFRHWVSQKILAWLIGPYLKREMGGEVDLLVNTVFLWERSMDFPHYWTPQIPPRPGAIHTLDCLADILEEEIGVIIPRDERFPQLQVRSAAREWAADYFARYELGAKPVVALVPESNMLIKKWSAAGWAYLSDGLYEQGKTPVIFSQPNSPLVAEIQQRAKHAPLLVATTLDNVTALLQLCKLCIGVDTGLLHIASAVETPWLGLFGPTNPEITGPYNNRIGRYLVAPFQRGENCRNCWKNFKYEDDKCRALPSGSCIDYLNKRQVLATALEMLEKPVTFLTKI